jgi:hypothetical protein
LRTHCVRNSFPIASARGRNLLTENQGVKRIDETLKSPIIVMPVNETVLPAKTNPDLAMGDERLKAED